MKTEYDFHRLMAAYKMTHNPNETNVKRDMAICVNDDDDDDDDDVPSHTVDLSAL